ncbi:hypothetical protein NYE25_15765 [Paenibacillus sp. FSL E2-8871]|jgi:hypothetical protein|uniref:Uncharacterized protein n=3 Tax=Paenibacillus TaxID=44249 RepID=A0A1R0ZBI3_9BACL|nr:MULTISPECIES: hypothetical protein [Paenibacillus]AIQ25829.1 hypothetical protein H70737_25020 [Paenibacillus sp. FSL H7-0737]KAA1187664.1 hypothetical protein PAENI_08420 [Paenibacillus sp. B2(2019)]OMD47887.1 hypothetical protein BSK51_23360 [Paenibacillus odorifer]OME66326.1 hypothetical protein BSK65_22370 [Paenibacillus odorifer]
MLKTVSVIFNERPKRWGLRGDPYLWDELERYFQEVNYPCTGEEFAEIFKYAFEELTGSSLGDLDKQIYCEKYSHGGMSSGHVCLEFWIEVAIPLLIERLEGLAI